MALTDCRECGATVSTGAGTCPSCGVAGPTAPAHRRRQVKVLAGFVAATVVLVAVAAAVVVSQDRAEDDQRLRQSCATLAEQIEGPAGELYRGSEVERTYRANCT